MSTLLRFFSRISFRLLAFNFLLVFLAILGLRSLEAFEDQLLRLQERSMVQQGRILAAALGERGPLETADALFVLVNLKQRLEARLRVIDPDFRVIADSSQLGPRAGAEDGGAPAETEGRRTFTYRLGSVLYRGFARLFLPPEPVLAESEFYATAEQLDGPEIRSALEGRYGSETRRSPGTRALALYSAIPIESGEEVVGAVLVSRSTFRVLQAVDDLRLDAFKVVLASVAAAVMLSLLVSITIVHPLKRLQREATSLIDRRGRLKRRFKVLRRQDEIGDLSRALAALTRRLERHIRFVEAFASDVSHEFKNPLASIRNATELLADIDDPFERQRFFAMVQKDIARLEHLLAGVREITRIDAQIEEDPVEPVDLGALLRRLVERYELQADGSSTTSYRLAIPDGTFHVLADPDRLSRAFENLFDNALSFSPPGDEIEVGLEARGGRLAARIRDRGPGIPEEHLDRIFGRFFSYRQSDTDGGRHTGLGLAIVKAIIEGYAGEVSVANHPEGGAAFEVVLPLRR